MAIFKIIAGFVFNVSPQFPAAGPTAPGAIYSPILFYLTRSAHNASFAHAPQRGC